jgi:Flp pilus assembly protein TadD
MEAGRLDEAEREARAAMEIAPGYGDAAMHLTEILLRQGRKEEAAGIAHAVAGSWERGGRGGDGSLSEADSEYHLAGWLERAGDRPGARLHFEKALALDPHNQRILNNLAWLMATAPEDSVRDGKRAVELALAAAQATAFRDPTVLDTLAAAFAEAGDFPKAMEAAHRALELSAERGDAELTANLRKEITLYERGIPLRERE